MKYYDASALLPGCLGCVRSFARQKRLTRSPEFVSPAQLVELPRELHRRFPDKKIILTCAGHKREKSKMSDLLAAPDLQPWRVFAGDLDLLELAAVMQASCPHFSGDTGRRHIAWMTGVPNVS